MQKNTALNRLLFAAAIATGTVSLSSAPAQAAGFTLNYDGTASGLAVGTTIDDGDFTDANTPVSGSLFISADENTAEETQGLVSLLSQGFGGIDFGSYTDLMGMADLMTPSGDVNLSFSQNGIDLAGPSFADRIASCQSGSCTITNTKLTVKTGAVSFSGRFDDLVATLPAPPQAVPEAGTILGLFFVAGAAAQRRLYKG